MIRLYHSRWVAHPSLFRISSHVRSSSFRYRIGWTVSRTGYIRTTSSETRHRSFSSSSVSTTEETKYHVPKPPIQTMILNQITNDDDDDDDDNNKNDDHKKDMILHIPPPLQPYICSSLPNKNHRYIPDTNFTISFLGTGGSIPTTYRNTSSLALRLGGLTYLFDAGEGTQRQFSFSRMSILDIDKIFITHMHGDHVLGLPGVLLQLDILEQRHRADVRHHYVRKVEPPQSRQRQRQRNERRVVEVYGPPGLFDYLVASLRLTYSTFATIRIMVYELVGGHVLPGEGNENEQRYSKDVTSSTQWKNVRRTFLYPNDDNDDDDDQMTTTWTLHRPDPIAMETIFADPHPRNRKVHLPNDPCSGKFRQLHIEAAEVRHVRGLPTFGYSVTEMDPPGNIDSEKALGLGVARGKKFDALRNGLEVRSDDGLERVVRPEEVVKWTVRGRKLVVLGDNCEVSRGMKMLCEGADVMVNEATLVPKDAMKAYERGHSTAAMSGKLAKEVNAKVLVLNHLNSISHKSKGLKQLQTDAQACCFKQCLVLPSFDFMELMVPRGGFDDLVGR